MERFLVDAYGQHVSASSPSKDTWAATRVVYTPATVPIHWTEKVKADLDRDVALRVLERVGPNEPSSRCHRMLVAGSIMVTHTGPWTCRL